MTFDGMAINESMLDMMLELVPNGTIFEFGSGHGTDELARHYKVYSVEHNKDWVGEFDSTYIYAPIVNGWYCINAIKDHMPTKYDLILVDGPNAKIGRRGFLTNIKMFDTKVPIFFDDAHREVEMSIVKEASKRIGRPYEVFKTVDKAFAVIRGKSV